MMAIEEIRQRVRRRLEELMDAESASWLMDRPPGGWNDLVTNQVLDAKLDAVRAELRAGLAEVRNEISDLRSAIERQTTRVMRWLLPVVFAAVVASSTLN